MGKPDVSSYEDFDQICDRLDQIVTQVRSNDTSLERSLDLFDEAIALGSKAVDMVDASDLTGSQDDEAQESRSGASAQLQIAQGSGQHDARPANQPSNRSKRKKRGRRR